MDIFRRYAPFIQDFIYRERWQSLRAVQNAAGDVLFNSGDNLLLSAATASGKTEAAFFPILTLLSEEPSTSVGVLYIAPLKALSTTSLSVSTGFASARTYGLPSGTEMPRGAQRRGLSRTRRGYCRLRRSRWKPCFFIGRRRFRLSFRIYALS